MVAQQANQQLIPTSSTQKQLAETLKEVSELILG